jgi:hypothetical protein
MRDKLDGNRTGLVVGLFFSGLHAIWLILVLFGFGQHYLNWTSKLHMLSSFVSVTNFDWIVALQLLVSMFAVGYGAGWVLTWAHNLVYKK